VKRGLGLHRGLCRGGWVYPEVMQRGFGFIQRGWVRAFSAAV
jgi:hypothetical protein